MREISSPLARWFKRHPEVTKLALSVASEMHESSIHSYCTPASAGGVIPRGKNCTRLRRGTKRLAPGDPVLPADWLPYARSTGRMTISRRLEARRGAR